MLRRGAQLLKNNYGGALHYLGNRYLSVPDISGHMRPDMTWLNEHFSIILFNHQEKYKRCIEPFSGSASWSLAAMEAGLAEKYIINDSDAVLINTLQLIQRDPERVKSEYAILLQQYESAEVKKQFFLDTIKRYNSAQNKDEKSLLLPFIINHSWGGIIFHDSHHQIIYQEKNDAEGKPIERFLVKANISLSEFHHEVDRTSRLFNENNVEFKSGDFLQVLSDVSEDDFVGLNPPYPENIRCVEGRIGMYTELYSPEQLHENLVKMIAALEWKDIHYYMTYDLYNPNFNQFVLRDGTGQPKNYFRLLGYAGCAFGTALDQVYWTSQFVIPKHLNAVFISASDILKGEKFTPEEALKRYMAIRSIRERGGLLANLGVFKQDKAMTANPTSSQAVVLERRSHL